IRPMFLSDNIKGLFFLTTLLDTIDYVINNLSIKDITSFINIKPKILNILEKHLINLVNSSAYAARGT
ncbi:hypothetical protein K504DRAFT_365896, partial [Pleomassaria siparia CBS 279.74]